MYYTTSVYCIAIGRWISSLLISACGWSNITRRQAAAPMSTCAAPTDGMRGNDLSTRPMEVMQDKETKWFTSRHYCWYITFIYIYMYIYIYVYIILYTWLEFTLEIYWKKLKRWFPQGNTHIQKFAFLRSSLPQLHFPMDGPGGHANRFHQNWP